MLPLPWPDRPFVVGIFLRESEVKWALASPNRILFRLGLLAGCKSFSPSSFMLLRAFMIYSVSRLSIFRVPHSSDQQLEPGECVFGGDKSDGVEGECLILFHEEC